MSLIMDYTSKQELITVTSHEIFIFNLTVLLLLNNKRLHGEAIYIINDWLLFCCASKCKAFQSPMISLADSGKLWEIEPPFSSMAWGLPLLSGLNL